MASYQHGGWYDNPATGKNQRYWNGGFLPVGQTDPAPANNNSGGGGGGGGDPMAAWRDEQGRQRAESERIRVENERKATELAAKQKLEMDNRFAGNKAEIGAFNTEYETKAPQLFNEVYDKFKIPTLSNAVNALNSRINDLKFNETGGASGYASGTQVDKAINTNYLPRYTNTVNALANSLDVGAKEYSAKINPLVTKGEMLSDRLARESTSYDTAQQRELEGLMETLKLNGNLTAAEWELGNALASKHMDYLATMKKIESDEKIASEKETNRYISLGNSSRLYDTQTGQFVTGGDNVGTGGSIVGADEWEEQPQRSAWIV